MSTKYFFLINNILGILNFFKTLNFHLLLKHNIINNYMLPRIKKIIFTITLLGLKNELDLKIINSLNILDLLLFKKTAINTLLQRYLHKTKTIVFVAVSTLTNKFDFFLFIFLILKIIKPSLKKRYIYLRFKLFQDGFSFYIFDISSIYELPEDLKKDRIKIKISVYFNKVLKKKYIYFFLYYFGFKKKKKKLIY
jgi:hypothetical protein